MSFDRRAVAREINGAIRDTFHQHPEYLPAGVSPKSAGTIRNSLAKRILGQVMSCLEQGRATSRGQEEGDRLAKGHPPRRS